MMSGVCAIHYTSHIIGKLDSTVCEKDGSDRPHFFAQFACEGGVISDRSFDSTP